MILPSLLCKMCEMSRHNTVADCLPNGSCWTTSPPWTYSPIDDCSKIYAERRRTCLYTVLLVWPKQTSLGTFPDMVPFGTIPTGLQIYCPYPKSRKNITSLLTATSTTNLLCTALTVPKEFFNNLPEACSFWTHP